MTEEKAEERWLTRKQRKDGRGESMLLVHGAIYKAMQRDPTFRLSWFFMHAGIGIC